MKKLHIWIMLLALIFCLAGCAKESSAATDTAEAATPEEATETSEAEPVVVEEEHMEAEETAVEEPASEEAEIIVEEAIPAINPLELDGAFFCLTGINDPAKYGLTIEEFLEQNPGKKEENLENNDDIIIFVFTSLYNKENKDDLTLPLNMYDSFKGKYLDLQLTIDGNTYNTGYELNNHDDRFSQHWEKYQDGSNLDTGYVLYAGGEESVHIVGYFSVKYHDYISALEENTEIVLNWGDMYSLTFYASDIEKQGSLTTIADRLREQGLIE